jgi:vancomycin resistance protein VanJ
LSHIQESGVTGTPGDEPTRRAAWTHRFVMASAVAWLLWLIGQLARDRTWLTGLCFYIPSPAMAFLLLTASLMAARGRRRWTSITLGIMAMTPCAMVAFAENQWTRPVNAPVAGEPIRLVHWNVAYGIWGWTGVEREIVRRRATLYVLSEVPSSLDLPALAARLGPGYRAVRVGGMAFVADGQLQGARRLVNEGGLKLNAVTWVSAWGPIKVLGVDGPSDLDVPRDPLLQRFRAVLPEHRPDLVAGDFNAPRRSRAISPLPSGFAHAYDRAGRGWSYTWPVIGPVYAIDQCIVANSVRPIRYELGSSRFSDHLLQSLEFQVVAPVP